MTRPRLKCESSIAGQGPSGLPLCAPLPPFSRWRASVHQTRMSRTAPRSVNPRELVLQPSVAPLKRISRASPAVTSRQSIWLAAPALPHLPMRSQVSSGARGNFPQYRAAIPSKAQQRREFCCSVYTSAQQRATAHVTLHAMPCTARVPVNCMRCHALHALHANAHATIVTRCRAKDTHARKVCTRIRSQHTYFHTASVHGTFCTASVSWFTGPFTGLPVGGCPATLVVHPSYRRHHRQRQRRPAFLPPPSPLSPARAGASGLWHEVRKIPLLDSIPHTNQPLPVVGLRVRS